MYHVRLLKIIYLVATEILNFIVRVSCLVSLCRVVVVMLVMLMLKQISMYIDSLQADTCCLPVTIHPPINDA